jgi:hypothetical protein
MKRFLNPEIALGFALGVLVLLFIASVLSYQIERCVNNPTQRSPIASAADRDGELNHHRSVQIACGIVGYKDSFIGYVDDNEGFFVTFFTFVLGLATVALWRSTDKLWTAGEIQRDQLKKTSERQLRAYVYLDNVWFKEIAPQKWEIKYRIKNVGQTPAHHVSVAEAVSIMNWNNGDVKLPEVPKHRVNMGSMAPQGDFYDSIANFDGHVTRTSLELGSKAIYLIGCIYYVDVFEEHRWSKFCYYVGGDVGCTGDEMCADEKGNDAQ